MVHDENGCDACSTFEGVYTLTASGDLAGGSTGAVTLVYDRKKNSVMARSASGPQYMTKLNSHALTRWRFAQQLVARYGFKLDDEATKMCSVSGDAGRCGLAPFPIAGTRSRSCDMFATATYAGDCIDGRLSGLCLISGIGHVAEGDVALGYFAGGRVLYPTFIASTRDETYPFGLQADDRVFYNCGKNFSAENDQYGCSRFRALFSSDIFSRAAHASLRDGTFNLAEYRASLEQRVSE